MHEVQWSKEEFGDAVLGDRRRRERLIAMGATVASSPAGNVTAVFSDAAEREGAYRFLENDDVDADEITGAAGRAAARRAQGPFAFVPVDGSSLNMADEDGARRMGRIGTRKAGALGVLVMTAIALDSDGTPLGVVGQRYWVRDRDEAPSKKDKKRASRRRRSVEDKETVHWLDVMRQSRRAFTDAAPTIRPWFQLDRGGDAWPVLMMADAEDEGYWLTVRAAADRRLVSEDEHQRYLWETMSTAPIKGTYTLDVPPSPDGKRSARLAQMTVHAAKVTLDLVARPSSVRLPTEIWAVWAHEESTCPEGEEPIEWMLLTNHAVNDLADARLVIHGYSQRWRVEQFHKAWKSGACHVEDTQLVDRDHVIIWATLLASVAMRVLRLTYLARTRPNEPATIDLTRNEIDAAILVSETKLFQRGDILTIAQAVLLIAKCGGYTGKSSGGPAGALVIVRGLRRIETVAKVLDKL